MTEEKRIITVDEVKVKITERFWSKIKFGGIDECWLWTGNVGNHGYGTFNIQVETLYKKCTATSHRYMYDKLIGIPKGKLVLHNCPSGDTKRCVNPNHLWIGTHDDNNKDAVKKDMQGRGMRARTAKLTDTQVVTIKKMLSEKRGVCFIANQFNISYSVISNIRRGVTWKHIKVGFEMPKFRSANKLTEDHVKLIRMRLDVGESQHSIARAFKITPTTICLINAGKTWKHVKV